MAEQGVPIEPCAADQLRGRGSIREGMAEVHPAREDRRATVEDEEDEQGPGAPVPAVLLNAAGQPECRDEEEPQVALMTQLADQLDIAEGQNAHGTETEGRQGHLSTPQNGGGQRQRQQPCR